jgi:hypothetical protein
MRDDGRGRGEVVRTTLVEFRFASGFTDEKQDTIPLEDIKSFGVVARPVIANKFLPLRWSVGRLGAWNEGGLSKRKRSGEEQTQE